MHSSLRYHCAGHYRGGKTRCCEGVDCSQLYSVVLIWGPKRPPGYFVCVVPGGEYRNELYDQEGEEGIRNVGGDDAAIPGVPETDG